LTSHIGGKRKERSRKGKEKEKSSPNLPLSFDHLMCVQPKKKKGKREGEKKKKKKGKRTDDSAGLLNSSLTSLAYCSFTATNGEEENVVKKREKGKG